MPSAAEPYSILVTGIGGTGVVTIGALLGMAAHLEGKGCSVLDMTGLAQKNGAVVSHVRIADTPEKLYATRIAAGEADARARLRHPDRRGLRSARQDAEGRHQGARQHRAGRCRRSSRASPTSSSPPDRWSRRSRTRSAPGDAEFLDATKLATGLMGDSIATNLFMVGYAYQRGLIPVSRSGDPAGDRAQRRRGRVQHSELPLGPPRRRRSGAGGGRRDPADGASRSRSACRESLDEMVARRVKFLTDYQDAAYAQALRDAGRQGRATRKRA